MSGTAEANSVTQEAEHNVSPVKFPARPENSCFGCGGGNPRGMKLEFEGDAATKHVWGKFKLGTEYQGGGGYLHGGIIAVVLDEAMGKLARLAEKRAVTAELSVEYLKPIPATSEIFVDAFETERNGRQLYHRAEIKNCDGIVLARGKGRFVVVRDRQSENK
jgi:acyl-coenzyme A thioesterase PaaI-like protein